MGSILYMRSIEFGDPNVYLLPREVCSVTKVEAATSTSVVNETDYVLGTYRMNKN